jgi:hypothetical protein
MRSSVEHYLTLGRTPAQIEYSAAARLAATTVCEPCPRGPSRCKTVVATILFDNTDKIPEGLYKQLMDALLIKD